LSKGESSSRSARWKRLRRFLGARRRSHPDLARLVRHAGLIDAHTHIEGGEGSGRTSLEREVDLRGRREPGRGCLRGGSRRGSSGPRRRWIFGNQLRTVAWPGGEFADRERARQGRRRTRPVLLSGGSDGHAGWANSEAMRRAKVTSELPDPFRGQILADRDGQPDGESSSTARWASSGRRVPNAFEGDLARQILAGPGRGPKVGDRRHHGRGALPGRIEVVTRRSPREEAKAPRLRMASPRPGARWIRETGVKESLIGDRFRSSIKLFMEGAMGSRGRHVQEPYSDGPEKKTPA